MHSFEVAADQILELIEAERADATEVIRNQLRQLEIQFNSFRNASYATLASKEAINAQCSREMRELEQTLNGIFYTLKQAGIHYSQGRLAFGEEWGASVGGLRSNSPYLPPPLLTPKDIIAALEMERYWRRGQSHAIWDHHLPMQSIQPGTSFSMSLIPALDVGENMSLKRAMPFEDLMPAAKRSKPVVKNEDWDTVIPGPITAGSASHLSSPQYSPIDNSAGNHLPFGRLISSSVSSPATGYNTPRAVAPIIERWKCALTEPKIFSETRSSSHYILPPLVALVDAHSCTYYMWFAIRSSLFRQLGDHQSAGPKASTTEEWEVRLHNLQSHETAKVEYVYNEKLFEKGGGLCGCGMPQLASKVLRTLALRADGTPIQSTDFDSYALQAFICADLELGHAKLQFEQADDILVDMSLWPAKQKTTRINARNTIFRNAWDLSFAAVPLELPDVLSRRSWILLFSELLHCWPHFPTIGSLPIAGVEPDMVYLDSLEVFEQRLITFYLQTVSNTLGVNPARPRQRPHIDTLPDLYRDIFS